MASTNKLRGLIAAFVVGGVLSTNVAAVETGNLDAAASPAVASVTDKIIVKYKNNSALAFNGLSNEAMTSLSFQAGERLQGLRQMASGAHVVKIDRSVSASDVEAIVKRLNAMPDVEYAEPDIMLHPMFTPNDQFYSMQWHYFEATGGIRANTAWDITTGIGAVVAVIDTGYTTHVDLVGNILPGYDMISDPSNANDGNGRDNDARDPGDFFGNSSSSWHGTHVAGTVAAVTNNGTGVAGVAFGAKVVPVRVLGRTGGSLSDIADGIVWAAGGNVPGVPSNQNPANVINMSLGGTASCGASMQNAINTARSLGTAVVVAAGNERQNAGNSVPANCNGVIAVAATNRSGGRASYSNFGSVVDLAAPGGDGGQGNGVLSTLNTGTTTPAGDGYAFYQGTSMATPHVAGVAALLYSVDPDLTPDQIESILKSTARPFPASCSQCGSGIVDAAAALAALDNNPPPPPPPTSGGFVIDNISGARRSFQFTTVDVPAGTSNLTVQISGGTGDADLYVRFGSRPTTRTFDCRPYLNGNNESCSFNNPAAGTWHIGLRGFTAYSGVTLTVSFE